MIPQIIDFLETARVLFVRTGCPHCPAWIKIVERLNLEVPADKMIKVIDIGMAEDFGGYAHPLLKLLDKEIKKTPTLFFEGNKITGSHTEEEVEAFLLSALRKDFIIPKENPYLFSQKCEYDKKGIFGRKALICEEV